MKIHYIQHASFEPLGIILNWAEQNGHSITGTNTYAGEKLPSTDEFDFLIVMGGPQSALHLDKHPYLKAEVALMKAAAAQNKHVLGICLGAQLLSAALNAPPEQSPEQEIGMFPITLTEAGQNDPIFKDFPETFTVMHWHNDMPGMPEDAVLLAQSAGCPRQAFRYGSRAYGLQCHFEFTRSGAEKLIQNTPHYYSNRPYVQPQDQFLAHDFSVINQQMMLILDRMAALPAKKQTACRA